MIHSRYDVAILGGGLAGLTLARHLLLRDPTLRVCVVEKREPPRLFTSKVGESSLGPQGIFYAHGLRLKEYFEEHHVEKFSLRYFFPAPGPHGKGRFDQRPEVGAARYRGILEYQFDRGKLECDLRRMVVEQGAELRERTAVERVTFGADGEPHRVSCAPESGPAYELEARWVVDASGRRRLLASQLGQKSNQRGRCSSAWWRVRGWIDVDHFVDGAKVDWHRRIDGTHPRQAQFGRVNSTTHLCGKGYWVWLIPLSDDVMSVGIVAHNDLVPFSDFNTYDKALAWLRAHEPEVADRLPAEPLDFKVMNQYSYPAATLVSADRWAMIGEALGFSDPYYSPGGDLIALANTIITQAIAAERAGTLTRRQCENLSDFMRTYVQNSTETIQSVYPCLGLAHPVAIHVVWDFLGLVFPSHFLINAFNRWTGTLAHTFDFLASDDGPRLARQLYALNQRVGAALLRWAQASEPPHEGMAQFRSGGYIDHGHVLRQVLKRQMRQPRAVAGMLEAAAWFLAGARGRSLRAIAGAYLGLLERVAGDIEAYVRDCQAASPGTLAGGAASWRELFADATRGRRSAPPAAVRAVEAPVAAGGRAAGAAR